MSNLFDLTDTTDLPGTLAKKAEARTSPNFVRVKEVMEEAGAATVNIQQVRAAIFRKTGTEMTEVTTRTYLNKLVEDGILVKPTRQTYKNLVVVE